jgi:hypothetical protein
VTDTSSTGGIEDALRTRLLSFQPLVGLDTLADVIGSTVSGAGSDGKLFWDEAPDDTTYPYGVLQLKNRRNTSDVPERTLVELEVMLFGRPRAQKATVEQAADLCEQAMLRYVDAMSGVLGCWGCLRNTLPVMTSPADREVVQVMLTFTLVVWPAYLTQYRDT